MDIKIKIEGDKAYIYSPKNPFFTQRVKKIGGACWTGSAWRIPAVAVDVAREFLLDEYGENDITVDKKIKVKLVAKMDMGGVGDFPLKICAFGKILAEAYGRDSGAYVGEDVILISGEMNSGGSMRRPYVYINEGSVLILTNVPKTFFERMKEKVEERFDIEVVEEKVETKDALEAEKKDLLDRINEIDRLLANTQD